MEALINSNLVNNKLKIANIVNILFLFISCFFFKNLVFIHIFAMIMSLIIYKFFSKSCTEYIFFITVFYALVGSAIRIHIYGHLNINAWYLLIYIYFINKVVKFFKEGKKFEIDIKNKFTIFCIFFILYALFSLIYVQSMSFALKMIKIYIVMIPLTLMFAMEKFSNKAEKICRFFITMYTGIIAIASLEILGFKFGLESSLIDNGKLLDDWNFYKRVPITFFYNQNNFAVVVVMGMILLVLAYMLANTKKDKIIVLVLYFFSQLCIVFTSSRTVIASLYLFLLATIILGLIIKNKILAITCTRFTIYTCILFVVLSLFSVCQPYYGKFQDLPLIKYFNVGRYIYTDSNISQPTKQKKLEDENLIKDREKLNAEANMSTNLRENILKDIVRGVVNEGHYFGFGIGNTEAYLSMQKNTNRVINAHSMWFEILGDYGILMLILFVYIYITMIFRLIQICRDPKSKRRNIALLCSIECFTFAFLSFGPSSVVNLTPFWILMGVSLSVLINNNEYNNCNRISD